MTTDNSKVTIHMVSSLDGYIANKDNTVTWLESKDHYEKGITLSEKEIANYVKNIDCYVMGSRTYEHALKLGWPYGETPVVVLTHRDLTTDRKNVEFYSGDLEAIVNERIKTKFKNIWVAGGSMLTKHIIRLNLADEIIISIMPVLLGDGTLFFDYIGKEKRLHLKDVVAYKDGMVEIRYKIIRNEHPENQE
jgi:dihydrofolate reductase